MTELEALEQLAQAHAQAAPGFSIALAHDESLFTASAGLFKVGEARPMDDAVRFPIGQLQKPMLAALAIHYALRQEFDLDEPVELRLPELAAPDLPSVTYRHILGQTTGVPDILHAEAADFDWDALADHFRHRLQAFPPGTVWSQSYCGHLILCRAIEQVGKASIADQIRDLILEPLGIHPERAGDRAAAHMPARERFPELAPLRLSAFFTDVVSALALPVQDIARLGRMFSGRLDHPLAEAALAMQRRLEPAPLLGVSSGAESVPDALCLGLVGYGGLLGASSVGSGSTCGLIFDPNGGGVAAVALNTPNVGGRDMLLMKALALTGARPQGARNACAPTALNMISGAYSGLTLGYETVWIGADGNCELQFARDRVSCQVRADPGGRLWLVATNNWSLPLNVFPDPCDGGPALMIGASAFKRC